MAIPRGSAFSSVSEIVGSPVELEKRTKTGVDGELKCSALESSAAFADGVNVPVSKVPFA